MSVETGAAQPANLDRSVSFYVYRNVAGSRTYVGEYRNLQAGRDTSSTKMGDWRRWDAGLVQDYLTVIPTLNPKPFSMTLPDGRRSGRCSPMKRERSRSQ